MHLSIAESVMKSMTGKRSQPPSQISLQNTQPPSVSRQSPAPRSKAPPASSSFHLRRPSPAKPVHPAHAPYLNKKIEQYDEMAIVVGKDMAIGGFSKQWSERSPLVENETPQNDIQNPEFEGDSDTLPKDAHEASNGTSSKGRSHRKRTYAAMNEDTPFSEMTEQLKQIVVAVTALSHGPVNTNELYKIVMNVEGFAEDMLDEAFDHLVNDEKAGGAFMAKNDRMRKLWLEKFFNKTF